MNGSAIGFYACPFCGRQLNEKDAEVCPRCRAPFPDAIYVPHGLSTPLSPPPAPIATLTEKPKSKSLHEVEEVDVVRVPTGFSPLDKALDGGFVRGSAVVLSGPPGAGKSTIATLALYEFHRRGETSLYVCGEEREYRLRQRCKRLGLPIPDDGTIRVYRLTDEEEARAEVRRCKAKFVVLDSLAVMETPLDSTAAMIERWCDLMQEIGGVLLAINHFTKNGEARGEMADFHEADVLLVAWKDPEHTPVELGGHEEPFEVVTLEVDQGKNRFGNGAARAHFLMCGEELLPYDLPPESDGA